MRTWRETAKERGGGMREIEKEREVEKERERERANERAKERQRLKCSYKVDGERERSGGEDRDSEI